MFDAMTRYHQTLRDRQLSNTSTRRLIFETLLESGDLSMNELTAKLKGNVNRASIYRSIQLFEAAGIVRRLNAGWKYRLELSEAYSSHHHHLTCINCHRVFSFQEDNETAKAITKLAEKSGFEDVTHQLEIRGLCADCQRKNK
jgi:Fur family ferric uptake transcriptional regulator